MTRLPSPFPLGNGSARVQSPAAQNELDVVIVVGNQVHLIVPENVVVISSALTSQLTGTENNAVEVSVNIAALPRWPKTERISCLQFLHRLMDLNSAEVRFQADRETVGGNLFNASINLIRRENEPSYEAAAVETALTAAAIIHPDAIIASCRLISERIRSIGLCGYRVPQLITSAERIARHVESEAMSDRAPSQLRRVRDAFPNAPVCDDIVIPLGWMVTPEGIELVGSGNGVTIRAPLFVCRILNDINSGDERLEVTWETDGTWLRHANKRSTFATPRQIVALADRSIPVTANNAYDLIEYIDQSVAANRQTLPRSVVSERLGWISLGGAPAFLTSEAITAAPANDRSGANPSSITFQGADEGDQQLVRAVRTRGSFEDWQRAISVLQPHDGATLALYAALAPPMLAVCETKNFLLSLSGPTSCGKTTALKVAGSCWGIPEVGSDGSGDAGFIKSWDATRIFIERSCTVLDSHPMLIDETTTVKSRETISEVIYDICAGRGRGRGSAAGLASSGTWHTVAICSGEESITAYSQKGGTRARTLELWNHVFSSQGNDTAQLVRDLSTRLSGNYGHAGPQLVRYLVANNHDRANLVGRFQQLAQFYIQCAENNRVAGRMAEHFAILQLTAELAHGLGIIPWQYAGAIERLWPVLVSETAEADRAAAALRHVHSWAAGHEGQFCDRHSAHGAPSQGWLGKWQCRGNSAAELCLGIIPTALNEVLSQAGFEAEAIKRMWWDRQWLRANPGRRDLRVRLGRGTSGPNALVIAIRWASIDEVLGLNEEAQIEDAAGAS